MKQISCHVRGYKGAGFGSGFIKWWTRSEYSHVSLVFDLGHVCEEIESIQNAGCIRHRPYRHTDLSFDEYKVPLTHDQIIEAHGIACSLLGARYDWQAIRSFIKHRKKHSLDKFICSEFVAYVLYKAGYKLSRREPFVESPATVCESLRLLEED